MPVESFSDLYPIKPVSDYPEFVEHKLKKFLVNRKTDLLFEELQHTENNTELASKKDDIFGKCDEIINSYIFSSAAVPRTIIASMFAIKMKLCDDLINSTEDGVNDTMKDECRHFIKNNYGNFLRSIDEATTRNGKLHQSVRLAVGYRPLLKYTDLADRVMLHLDTAITLKNTTNIQDVCVPDILASVSHVEDSNVTQANIRELFRELWEVNSLRPLLTVAAHCTQEKENPLTLAFIDQDLSGYSDRGTAGLCRENHITISLSNKSVHGEDIPESNSTIKGFIVHELHHYWEQVKHNNFHIPYQRGVLGRDAERLPEILNIAAERLCEAIVPEQFYFGREPNTQTKIQLRKMLKEDEKIKAL